MKIIEKKIDTLIEAWYNPRMISEKQREALKKSITEFGMIDPIIVNTQKGREGIVVGGHQRLSIWKELGNETIPTVEVNLNEEEERELNIRLNKNTGEFDIELLNKHFTVQELGEYGFEEYEIGTEEVDLSILDEMEEGDIELTHRNVIQIEFDQEHYEEAKTLHKTLKDANLSIGALFIKKMQKEKK